jgi:hypothetical protein
MADVLLFCTCENIVQVIIKEEKAIRLDLVLEKLAAWIVCHGKSDGICPFQKTALSHGRETNSQV